MIEDLESRRLVPVLVVTEAERAIFTVAPGKELAVNGDGHYVAEAAGYGHKLPGESRKSNDL